MKLFLLSASPSTLSCFIVFVSEICNLKCISNNYEVPTSRWFLYLQLYFEFFFSAILAPTLRSGYFLWKKYTVLKFYPRPFLPLSLLNSHPTGYSTYLTMGTDNSCYLLPALLRPPSPLISWGFGARNSEKWPVSLGKIENENIRENTTSRYVGTFNIPNQWNIKSPDPFEIMLNLQ